MDSLHKQITKLSYALIKKTVEDPSVIMSQSMSLEGMVPVELRPIYQQAKYIAPSTYSVLRKRLSNMIELIGEEDVLLEMDDIECPDDNEAATLILELDMLNGKKDMQETLAKSIADLESGEVAREQEAVDRVSLLSEQYTRSKKVDDTLLERSSVDIQNDSPEDIKGKMDSEDRSHFPRTGTVFDTWMILGPGELGILLAGPAVGKTTGMIDIGSGYVENNHEKDGVVIHFSEEMSMVSVLNKYMARLGCEDLNELKNLGGLVIESHASGTSTIPFLKSRIINLLNGRRPLCIIIDYLAILQRNSGTSGYDSLSQSVVEMRGLAGYFGCPCWTGSQPQRGGFKEVNTNIQLKNFKPPVLGMSDVAECWAIPHVSDYVVSMNQTDEEKEKEIPEMRIHRAKARIPNEQVGKKKVELTVSVQVNYPTCQIR